MSATLAYERMCRDSERYTLRPESCYCADILGTSDTALDALQRAIEALRRAMGAHMQQKPCTASKETTRGPAVLGTTEGAGLQDSRSWLDCTDTSTGASEAS